MSKKSIQDALENLRLQETPTSIEVYKSVDNINTKLMNASQKAIRDGKRDLSEYFGLCHRILTGSMPKITKVD